MAFAAIREKLSAALPWIEKSRSAETAAAAAQSVQAPASVIPFPPAAGWVARFAGSDPRCMSPRQMQDLSRRLFEAGQLSEEDSLRLGAHAELHPDYPRTVGAITNRAPLPDIARDQLAEWEQRLAFIRRHAPGAHHDIERIGRILDVLSALAAYKTGTGGRYGAGAIVP